MDTRSKPRIPAAFLISFTGDELSGHGWVTNLSPGGCAIESDRPVQKGTFLDLRMHGPDEDATVLEVDLAAVRWSFGRRFGVEFLRIRIEEQTRLHHLITDSFQASAPAREPASI